MESDFESQGNVDCDTSAKLAVETLIEGLDFGGNFHKEVVGQQCCGWRKEGIPKVHMHG